MIMRCLMNKKQPTLIGLLAYWLTKSFCVSAHNENTTKTVSRLSTLDTEEELVKDFSRFMSANILLLSVPIYSLCFMTWEISQIYRWCSSSARKPTHFACSAPNISLRLGPRSNEGRCCGGSCGDSKESATTLTRRQHRCDSPFRK